LFEVAPARSGEALEMFVELSEEYVTWITAEVKRRYRGLDVEAFNAERGYDDIRKKYLKEHVPPRGDLLLAVSGKEACGCVAVGRLTKTICEMRTLYVRPAFRGEGLGRALAVASVEQGRRLGYRRMRLDTLSFLEGAIGLYRSLGFRETKPYHGVSGALEGHIRFMELSLLPSRTKSTEV